MTQHLRFDEIVETDREILPFGSEMSDFCDADWRALQDLRKVHRFVGRSHRIMEESAPVKELRILCKGWALRSVAIDDERRQILDFLLPGDIFGFNVDGYGCSLCDVDALTACEFCQPAIICGPFGSPVMSCRRKLSGTAFSSVKKT